MGEDDKALHDAIGKAHDEVNAAREKLVGLLKQWGSGEFPDYELTAWGGEKVKLTFQSRFGRAEWIKPYTDATVEELARSGIKRLAIVTPGFAADCIETLEEIAEENREIFLDNGGEKFSYIPCLNDSEDGIKVLVHLIEHELEGWL